MAEQPPLSRIHVIGYSANDRNFPLLAQVLDPRVAGYKVPEDLSACPDKRYPNHVFTGAQPISGDQRVRHVWEILPSPWVPFTRYDDDLGPIQGRRRFVKNEGQQASLTSSTKTSYEAREGSALVSSEIEESWSIKVDEDGNSLFPIKDRDFYDASRGPVQERRQLFVPTGEEAGSLENVDGVITQTSYEPYNEFLSVKIVQTYKVDGPQLVGRSTDNDGQLVTVTSQRKGAKDYVPPNPTATRTVEVNREDAESLIERIIDTPEVFKANTFSLERPDPIPQKFRVAVPLESSQEIVEGTAEMPALASGEISRTEEQRNKFIKRVSATSRDQTVLPQTLVSKSTDNDRQEVTITETLQTGDTEESPTATTTVESDALGDGNYVVRKTKIPEVFSALTLSKERPDPVPQKFRVSIPLSTRQETLAGVAQDPVLTSGEIANSEQQVNKFVKRVSSTTRDAAQLPKSLTQKTTTNEGLLATVTETLQSGDTSTIPSAKKTVESEALGDGTYVVRVTEAPEVFSAKTFRAEKADLTPQKFRAKQSDLTTEENVEGTAAAPTLGANQFLKSEQQINKFVKRVTTTTRETELNETLNESVITPEGQRATRTITLAKASQTLAPSATLIDGSVEELGDGRTVKTEVSVDSVFGARQESLEKPEVIPPEFRASLQNKTVSEIKAGQSAAIASLSQGELSKSIQRITEHKIRETVTTRPTSTYPNLNGEFIDNDGVKVERVRTVAKSDQSITPSATVSGTVEALGDGFTLKTLDTKRKIFNSRQKTLTQSVQVPSKFFNGNATETSFIEEGSSEQPEPLGTDGFGVTQSSSQRISEFLRRQTKREQNGVTSLTEYQINNAKQKITVTSTISDDPEVASSATTEFARAQAIGGGKYIKEVGVVDSVFDSALKSAQKPDTIPEKFRVNSPIKRSEETVEATDIEEPSLDSDEFLKSEQRLTEFTIQKTTVTRDDNFNEVESQRLEENWGINIPYKEYISESIPSGENYEAEGLDDKNHLIREYKTSEIESILSNFSVTIPTSIDLDLPRVLKKITVDWQEEKSSSISELDTSGAAGASRSLVQQDQGRVSSSLSLIPKIETEFDDIWGKNLPATIHLFFLKKENLTDDQIRSKIGASENWPVFQLRSFSTTVFGKSETKEIQAAISRATEVNETPAGFLFRPSKSSETTSSVRLTPVSINIPPCLTKQQLINQTKTLQNSNQNIELEYQSITMTLDDGSSEVIPAVSITKTLSHQISCLVKFTIPQTPTYQDIPRDGTYLISSSAEPYKFGWFLVRAISFDASIF